MPSLRASFPFRLHSLILLKPCQTSEIVPNLSHHCHFVSVSLLPHQTFVDESVAGLYLRQYLLAAVEVDHHHWSCLLAVDGVP